MFAKLFKNKTSTPIPSQIYGGLMTQAREPAFYAEMGVSDSVMGRFDMLSLHVFLLTRRLKHEPSPLAAPLGQEVFDLFVDDLDRALRQLGVGDTTVPKRKKKMVHSFYAQIDEFEPEIDNGNHEALQQKIAARFLQDNEADNAHALTQYVFKTADHLAATGFDNIKRGNITWPQVTT